MLHLQELLFIVRRTFTGTNDASQLITVCRDLAKKTVDELLSDRIQCKRVTLKIKTINFEILTRSKTLTSYTDSLTVITDKAVALLQHELDQDLELPALRLMGKNEYDKRKDRIVSCCRCSSLGFENEKF